MELNKEYLRKLVIRRVYEDSVKLFLDQINFEYFFYPNEDEKKKKYNQLFEVTIITLAVVGYVIEMDFKLNEEYSDTYHAYIGVILDELSTETEYAEIFYTDDFELFMTMSDRIVFYKQEIKSLIENYIYEPPYGIFYYFLLNPGNYSPYAEYTKCEEQEIAISFAKGGLCIDEMTFMFALKDIHKYILNRIILY